MSQPVLLRASLLIAFVRVTQSVVPALVVALTLYAIACLQSVEFDQLFVALASAQAEDLARKSLDLALGDEPARTTAPTMIARVASHSPSLAWQFALDHLETLQQRLDALQRLRFVPSLAGQGTSDQQLEALRKYIDERVPADFRKLVEKFYSDLEFRLKLRRERIPEITKWLQTA